MYEMKKTLNLKCSNLNYFKEKNHEIWSVNSNMVFQLVYVKKTIFFDFKKKKYSENLIKCVWSFCVVAA